MEIEQIIKKAITQIDQAEERMVPRKTNKLRDLRIVDSKTLILKNLPITTKNYYNLYKFPYFGQFKNIKSITPFRKNGLEPMSGVINFNCEISACFGFLSILALKLKNEVIEVFFREDVVCLEKRENCSCLSIYHLDNRPEKAYFYKRVLKKKNYGYLNFEKKKENGEINEDIENIDFEYHVKLAYSTLESSKLKIKTNYLNFFRLEKTIFPDILKIFESFHMMKHISGIFKSLVKANENEVINEFDDILQEIEDYNNEFKNISYKSLSPLKLLDLSNYDKEKETKKNRAFLEKKTKKYKTKKKIKTQNFEIEKPIQNFEFFDIYENDVYMQFYNERLEYYQFYNEKNKDGLICEEERLGGENEVILNYREKNYYHLKKSTKAKKKAKKAALKFFVLNEENDIKKKRRKREKKK